MLDGVEHSVFASGAMPLDRSTTIGPFRIEVVEPIRTIRYVVEPNEHGIEGRPDLPRDDGRHRGAAAAHDVDADGVLMMDHTRLTQWGTWEGTISVDGDELRIDPSEVPGTRDRSWGMRPVGQQLATNWPVAATPQAFWLWAPLHFADRYTHLALHEYPDGTRWLETVARARPAPGGGGAVEHRRGHGVRTTSATSSTRSPDGARSRSADLWFSDPDRRRGAHRAREGVHVPHARHRLQPSVLGATAPTTATLETGRESIKLDDFDPLDWSSIHLQNLVIARMGDRTGIGVLEQAHFGPHTRAG